MCEGVRSMAGKAPKRFRASNFSNEEVNILLDLVEDHKDVLESKETDATTWREKDEEWEIVSGEFNRRALTNRTSKELRAKFVGLKKLSRKKAAEKTQSLRATGGGPPPKESHTDEAFILERVHSLIRLSADGLDSRFDTDHMHPRECSADEDEPQEIDVSVVDDIGGGMVVAASEINVDWPESTPSARTANWGHYTPSMLRTPKSAPLAWKSVPASEPAPSNELESAEINKPKLKPTPSLEPVPGAKPVLSPNSKLRSRRRPVLRPKKMAEISGSNNKFTTLAEVKTQLARVQLEASLAKNANAEQREAEMHDINMKIKEQELRRLTALAEQEEYKLKRQKENH